MATWHHCWRCQKHVPMLDELEWELIHPLLTAYLRAIQAYRELHGTTLDEALKTVRTDAACAKSRELTGFAETNVNAIHHHRRSLYGPKCTQCGELLRTPRSRRCVGCGQSSDPR